jgi:hypothetical protein
MLGCNGRAQSPRLLSHGPIENDASWQELRSLQSDRGVPQWQGSVLVPTAGRPDARGIGSPCSDIGVANRNGHVGLTREADGRIRRVDVLRVLAMRPTQRGLEGLDPNADRRPLREARARRP